MNRFHNKYHKHNHHTTPIGSDVDSANDPIASAASPFLGDFHLSGDFNVSGDVLVDGGTIYSNNAEISSISAEEISGANIYVDSLQSKSLSAIELGSDMDIGAYSILSLDLNKIDDVVLTSPSVGQFLYFDGLNWINSPYNVFLATDDQATSGIETTVAINPKQLHFADHEYVALSTYGGSAIAEETAASSYVYELSGFAGSGLNTDEIREIYIQVRVRTGAGNRYATITCTYPDSVARTIAECYSYDGNDEVNSKYVVTIPINKAQTSFTVTMSNSSGEHSHQIIAAKQRTFSA